MADVDLDLLATFVRVYEAGNVTRAAADLGLSQPTVSHALGRLRRRLDDELFVRAPGGVRPTELADALYRDSAGAIGALRVAVERARGFDPTTSQRRFRLALTDLGETAILPGVVERLVDEAPRVDLEVVAMDVDQARTWLLTGEVDLAVATTTLGGGLADDLLFDEWYVLAMRRGHPLAHVRLTPEHVAAASHVVVPVAVGHRIPEQVMDRLHIDHRVALSTRTFAAVPAILERTDLVAVLPWGAYRSYPGRAGLVTRSLPFDVPEVSVRLYHRREGLSPAVEWLRRTVVAASVRPDDWADPEA
ncbi:LysR family transcriptional regulator [Georgenia sp. Z1491]|uniref:LysR family transcriptional regulator n=1 Tax=Georgenia sp. Z1491 TaxID=3416707 RepID=UPI003CE6B4FA